VVPGGDATGSEELVAVDVRSTLAELPAEASSIGDVGRLQRDVRGECADGGGGGGFWSAASVGVKVGRGGVVPRGVDSGGLTVCLSTTASVGRADTAAACPLHNSSLLHELALDGA
jgi:hypothetical protein